MTETTPKDIKDELDKIDFLILALTTALSTFMECYDIVEVDVNGRLCRFTRHEDKIDLHIDAEDAVIL